MYLLWKYYHRSLSHLVRVPLHVTISVVIRINQNESMTVENYHCANKQILSTVVFTELSAEGRLVGFFHTPSLKEFTTNNPCKCKHHNIRKVLLYTKMSNYIWKNTIKGQFPTLLMHFCFYTSFEIWDNMDNELGNKQIKRDIFLILLFVNFNLSNFYILWVYFTKVTSTKYPVVKICFSCHLMIQSNCSNKFTKNINEFKKCESNIILIIWSR